EDIEPVQLAMFRWLGVALLVSPILFKNFSNITKVLKENFLLLNVLALLSITGFNTILYIGLNYTTATNALLINSFIPIMILVLSYFILKIQIRLVQLLGILLSTFGVFFLILRGDFSTLSTLEFNLGDILIFGSSFIWALYSVLIRFRPKELGDFEFFTTIAYIGLFWLLVIYFSMGYSLTQDISLVQNYYAVFIYVALFASVASYYFWHKGIQEIGANKAGQFTHLMPLFGSILAYLFLGEKLSAYHVIGAIFIGAGIYLSLFMTNKTKGNS
nr:DMT family transporter [Sulfurimonas sp.]